MNILALLTGLLISNCGDSITVIHEDGNLRITSISNQKIIVKNSLLSQVLLFQNNEMAIIKQEIVQFSKRDTPQIVKLVYLDVNCKLILKTFSNNRSDINSLGNKSISLKDMNLNILNGSGEVLESIQISDEIERILNLLKKHFQEVPEE